MTLVRQIPRTCLIWRHLGEWFGTTTGEKLWESFYGCLEGLGEEGGAEAPIRYFLESLVRIAKEDDRELDAELEANSSQDPRTVVQILREWEANQVVDQLFGHPIDRAAASFYLSQMAYVLGALHVAKELAIQAQKALAASVTAQEGKPPLALTILEFLVFNLILEINFLAEGSVGLEESLKSFHQFKDHYAREFVEVTDHKRLARSGGENDQSELTEPMRLILHALQAEVRNGDARQARVPGRLGHPALAFELSRKNHAGMLLFRLREWRKAEVAFQSVVDTVNERRHAGMAEGFSILAPLELEAHVYLGRLAAQRCEFAHAISKLEEAIERFRKMGDTFAANKARRYLAEIRYRQLDWGRAEEHLKGVLRTSERLRFDHDAAVAQMFLGKIYSRFGFQEWAAACFERAHRQFGSVGLPREYIDSIFWQAAAQARYLDITGHPKEHVINAKAILKTYRQLFTRINRDAPFPPEVSQDPVAMEQVEALRRSTRYERHPDLLEAMLELRLGRLPDADARRSLGNLAAKEGPSIAGWNGEAHAYLCHQLVRLVFLQEAREWAKHPSSVTSKDELKKYFVRDAFIDTLTTIVASPSCPLEICRLAQKTFKLREGLDLRGGFVPSLVDISQFFADRNCFVAMLLLLEQAIDEGIRQGTDADIDVEILKAVYRSITKYLVLERNFYLGPPAFDEKSTNTPALWRRLEDAKRERTSDNWSSLYRSASRGRYGIDYPSHAVALGWVDSFGKGSATLVVVWLDEQHGKPLTEDSFQELEVPIDVLRAGHSEENLAPIALVGRIELAKGGSDWVAHRLPSLDKGQLFEREPFGKPRLKIWQEVFSRFVGDVPTVCQTPEVSAEVEERFRHYANSWFFDKLSPQLFEYVFGFRGEDEGDGQESSTEVPVEVPPRAVIADPATRELLEEFEKVAFPFLQENLDHVLAASLAAVAGQE